MVVDVVEGKFRAAAVQMRSGVDPDRNIVALADGVRDAVSQGAHYVQTPEMTGALVRDRASLFSIVEREESDRLIAAAANLASSHSIYLHIGSTAIKTDGEKIANRSFLFAPDGKIIGRYDKIHMFDVDLDNGESWRESATYQPGRHAGMIDLPFARLGFGICYDVRFPELFQAQALAGAQVLSVPAAFTRQTGEAHWHVLLRARAIENGAFVIAAAQGGVHEDGRETYGHSMIVDPWGRILAEANHDEPGVIVSDIDVRASNQARSKIPNLKNRRPFDLHTADVTDGSRASA